MTDRRIPAAHIREVWLDPRISTRQAAARVGLSRSNLWRRAKALGLPPRPRGRLPVIGDEAIFAALWRAGVTSTEIARHFRCHPSAVREARMRLGLPPRRAGGHKPHRSVADVVAEMEAGRFAAVAAAEQKAQKARDMVDVIRGPRQGARVDHNRRRTRTPIPEGPGAAGPGGDPRAAAGSFPAASRD